MWEKIERKFGKYAIPRLMNYIIGCYIIGYIFQFGYQYTQIDFLSYLSLDPYQITHITNGFPIPQFWRIFSWLMVPPDYNLFFALIMMIFYWQLGTALERTWGVFRFNIYIFSGILFTVIGAFILYFYTGQNVLVSYYMSRAFTTNYINMSIFLAFSLCYPNLQVLLYFIIPVKMKWMAIFYGIIVAIDFFTTNLGGKVVIVSSLLNFIIFYILTRDYYRISNKNRSLKIKIKRTVKNKEHSRVLRHKCCICGRDEKSNPELEFRFCSKCNGNYEYCEDHLFTHPHKH